MYNNVMSIYFPNYDHSILSLSASLLHSYGAACPHPGLPLLDGHLAKPRKNTVLIILDGLGSDILENLLPTDSFLRSHKVDDLSSVYPCTTTAATTTLMSGLSPLEHGWLGWSPWFREYGRVVDLFLDRDTFSGHTVTPSPGKLLLPYVDLVTQIGRAAPAVTVTKVMPPFDPNGFASLALMAERIRQLCAQDGPQLVLVYWHEPDTLMHSEGPYSTAVRADVAASDLLLGELAQTIKDTLFIISADHGQIEVEREVYLDDIPELSDCLILPPSLESRAISLFVKPERKLEFAQRFEAMFGDCYLLLPREEVFARGLFGPGTPHHKIDDFIGDYLACATGGTIIRYRSPFVRPHTPFKGHHAGLCHQEMVVPLIVAGS